jgi:hypothetical protein
MTPTLVDFTDLTSGACTHSFSSEMRVSRVQIVQSNAW